MTGVFNRFSDSPIATFNRAWLAIFTLIVAVNFLPHPLRAADAEEPNKVNEYKDKDGVRTLIDPSFVPPSTLKELDDLVGKWNQGEIKDTLKLYDEFIKKNPPPVSVAEALKLKNDSDENNAKIKNTLRQLPSDQHKADMDATFNRRMKGDVTSTNPVLVQTFEDFDIEGLTAATLFGFDWDMNAFAASDFVKSWDRSPDFMYDKIVMRDDLVWSDGTPMTAHDVEFSFQLIMRPQVIIPAVRNGTDELKHVKAYDDHTLVVFHKKPLVTNVWNMLFPFLPKHIYEKTWKDDPKLTQSEVHRKLELKPVVGGPYEIESRKYNEEIVLKRRENYYMYKGKQVRDIPYFKHIRFRIVRDPNTALLALNRGDIEEMELTMQQWKNQTIGDDFYASNTKARNSEWLYFYFGWNGVKQPIFADKNVRVAMSYAFNHQEMLDKLNYGLTQPSLGPMHPESWQFPKEAGLKPYKHDVDKALDILENAGWEDTDGDGILDKVINGKKTQFEFTLIVLNDPPRIEICALLKNTLDKMGIKCIVQPLELTTMSKKMIEKDFEAAYSGWGTGANPDTASNIWTTKAIADGRNYVSYSNKQVDGLFELGKQVPTAKAERERIVKVYELGKVGIGADADLAKIYGKINEIIYLDQPYTFLYYRSAFYGFNKSLRGYHFSPRGPYHFGPGISSIWKAMQ